jgi:serine/threonine protein kinase
MFLLIEQTEDTLILDWPMRFNICMGIAQGLGYLHEEVQPCIIHQNIKLKNILLDNNFNPKIADFGLV